jgi:short-subunit dehydrogenase
VDGTKRALVTGASRGIGKAVAAALAAGGYAVTGTCRDPRRLGPPDRLAGVDYLPLDLGDPGSIDRLIRKVKAVDVLVNNAGSGQIGPAEEARLDGVRSLFEAHFFGPVRLMQAFVPGMRARGSGAVVNIGSIRSEIATPFHGVYAAAKAALRSFTDSLRMEVARDGVKVVVVSPFPVRTGLPQEQVMRPRSPYAARVRQARRIRDRDIARGVDPAEVAALVVRVVGMRRPGGWYTAGRNARLLSFLIRHLPRKLAESVASRKYDLPAR